MSSSQKPRSHVKLSKEFVSDVSNSEFPGHYPGEDHSWDLEKFKQGCSVQIQRLSQRTVEFDLIGVDASIANALRRVLLAEVSTIAIEDVYVWNNTSVIQDEVLAHRLGLIPLNIDPRVIKYRGDAPTDQDTVVFKLQISCERNKQASANAKDPEELYINSNVLSSELKWVAQGEQADAFKDKPPAPSNLEICLAKLRPGQELDIEMHAVKGIGSDHAKWSPVATASYRLMPHIKLTEPIPPHLCNKFASMFSPGVVEVVSNPETHQNEVKIVNPRNDTVSREVLRHPEFAHLVELTRIRDFFIYQVESEGPYKPEELLPEAVSVLRNKIKTVRDAVARLRQVEIDDAMDQS